MPARLGRRQQTVPWAADVGREFIRWAAADLETYADRCWDAKTGAFVACMTDGTPLRWKEARTGYYVPSSFAPRKPDGTLLWGYATAYRLTCDAVHWRMVRQRNLWRILWP